MKMKKFWLGGRGHPMCSPRSATACVTRKSSCGKLQEAYWLQYYQVLHLLSYPMDRRALGGNRRVQTDKRLVWWIQQGLPHLWLGVPHPHLARWGVPHLHLARWGGGVSHPHLARWGVPHHRTRVPPVLTDKHLWKHNLPSYYVRGR